MRQRLDNAEIMGMMVYNGLKLRSLSFTLTAAMTIDNDSPPIINLDAVAATRIITLPAVEEGLTFIISNRSSGAGVLTINNPAAATIGDLLQGEAGIAFCAGGVWYFRLIGAST